MLQSTGRQQSGCKYKIWCFEELFVVIEGQCWLRGLLVKPGLFMDSDLRGGREQRREIEIER